MGRIKCCFGCVAPKRHVGCHSVCLEYIKECEENKKAEAARRQFKVADDFLYERINTTMNNMRKRA